MQFELDQEAVAYIRSRPIPKAEIGIILGSGLGPLVEEVEQPVKIAAAEIPHYPLSTVAGHRGNLVFGRLAGIPVLMVQGRVHYYEGYSAEKITFAVCLMAAVGIRFLIVTSAAGAVNPLLKPGNLMLVTDHINLIFGRRLLNSPPGYAHLCSLQDFSPRLRRGFEMIHKSFRAKPDEIGLSEKSYPVFQSGMSSCSGERFLDRSNAYSSRYFDLITSVARAARIKLQRGVLCAMAGPCYETAAEVRMLARLGADAVSMSMVPEVLAAHKTGLEVIGLACITNMATGIGRKKLNHAEVIRVADKVKEKVFKLIRGIIKGVNK